MRDPRSTPSLQPALWPQPTSEQDPAPDDRVEMIGEAARDLARLALSYRETSRISPFALPEVMLLASIELAAAIDGTPEGTLEWLENVLQRLRRDR